LSPDEKREFVEVRSTPAQAVPLDFDNWLGVHYSDPEDYVEGVVPSVADALSPAVSFDSLVNDSRAWTWEVRIPAAEVRGSGTQPMRVIWTQSDYEEFESWVTEGKSNLSPIERDRLMQNVEESMVVTSAPATQVLRELKRAF